MPNERPVAGAADPGEVCTLSAEGLEGRLAWIRAEILPHAVESERLADGLALELRAEGDVAAKLDRLVALEKECCASIDFVHLPGRSAGRRRLEIHGVDPEATVFQGFQSVPIAPVGSRGRLAKAAGIGLLGSVLVCCVLPMGAAALLGAAAAPLAGLDAPLPIALGAGLGGLGAWWWLGRPRAESIEGCGPNC